MPRCRAKAESPMASGPVAQRFNPPSDAGSDVERILRVRGYVQGGQECAAARADCGADNVPAIVPGLCLGVVHVDHYCEGCATATQSCVARKCA